MLNVSKCTVADIVHRYIHEDRIDSIRQNGRPKLLDSREERKIVRKIKNDPKGSAIKLAAELFQESGKKVHPDTVRRVLKNHGYNGRVPRRKPYINEVNRKKRLNFATDYVSKDQTWWNNVIFADESKFNLFGSDGRRTIRRKVNEELKLKNFRATVKHGDGSVMVWGCISTAGVGELVFIDGILDKMKYLDLLKQNLIKSAVNTNIRNSFMFYRDNDPKHKSRILQEYLLCNRQLS